MVKAKKTKRTGILVWIMIPLIIVIGILAYYQLFYKSPRIEVGETVSENPKTKKTHRGLYTRILAELIWDNQAHTETVVDVAFSHSGKLLASTSDDKTIRNLEPGRAKAGTIDESCRTCTGSSV